MRCGRREPAEFSFDRTHLAICAAVLVSACVGIYGSTLRHGFVWDDEHYVVPVVQDLTWPALVRVLGSDLLQAGDPDSAPSGYWRPLASLTLWADGSLRRGAGPFHATNVALHTACAVLLLVLLARRIGPAAGVLVPLVAALAWALHPEQVETVSWVSCRYELLTGLFAVVLMLVRSSARPASLAVAAVVFAAGMLSKESFPALAVVLLADDWASGRRVRDALPSWVAFASVTLVVLLARRALGIGTPPVPWPDAPWNYLSAIVIYLGRAVAPLPLTIGHPYAGPAVWMPLVGGAALVLLLAAAVRWRRIAPAVALFLGPLVPLGLAMGGIREAPERYFYLPSLGLAWLLGEGLAAAHRASPSLGRASVAAAALATAAGAVASVGRIPDWRDNRSLYSAELRHRPDDWRANLFMGDHAVETGRLDDAMMFLRRAEAGVPSQAAWRVEGILARAHFLRGDGDAAVEHATAALRLAPRRPMPYLLLAAAYHAKGAHGQEYVVADAGVRQWPNFVPLRLPRASAMCEVAPGPLCESELERIAQLGGADAADAYAELVSRATARRDARAASGWLEALRRSEVGHPRLRELERALPR